LFSLSEDKKRIVNHVIKDREERWLKINAEVLNNALERILIN
jgi:hypothetical protein